MTSMTYPESGLESILRFPARKPRADPNRWPRILIVDDDRDLCLVMSYFLRGVAPGQRIRAEDDPVKAKALLREFRPDILVTDLAMPVLDGIRLSRIAGSDPLLPGLKIVAVTAQTGVRSRFRAFSAGVQEVVAKPFSRQELRAAVRRALGIDDGTGRQRA